MTVLQLVGLVVLITGLVLDYTSTKAAARLGLREKTVIFRDKFGHPRMGMIAAFAIATVAVYVFLTITSLSIWIGIFGIAIGMYRFVVGIKNFRIVNNYRD